MTNRFRVWDGDYMHEPPHGFVIACSGELYEHITKMRGLELRRVEHTIIPCTGLTDSEETPIYEGDIVNFWDGRHEEVYWSRDRWTVLGPSDNNCAAVLTKNAVVIGNVYQHPDRSARPPIKKRHYE